MIDGAVVDLLFGWRASKEMRLLTDMRSEFAFLMCGCGYQGLFGRN